MSYFSDSTAMVSAGLLAAGELNGTAELRVTLAANYD
jgi:hypothetical protein